MADALRKIKSDVAGLDIQSEPPGATLYINRKDLGSHGEAPRVLGVAPGSYTVIAELQGHEPARIEVTALAAGDVRLGSTKRVASAVGEGSMAVQFIHEYLASN